VTTTEPVEQVAECAFCRIVSGFEPADLVLDDAEVVGFLDTRPLFPGHVLLVPRHHVEVLGELGDAAVASLFRAVREVSVAVEEALGAHGSFVANNNRVSQSVPHLHVHVVPRRRKDGLRGFFWPRTRYASAAESAQCAARLRDALAR
jgi:histidine triad (HIT) family protein